MAVMQWNRESDQNSEIKMKTMTIRTDTTQGHRICYFNLCCMKRNLVGWNLVE